MIKTFSKPGVKGSSSTWLKYMKKIQLASYMLVKNLTFCLEIRKKKSMSVLSTSVPHYTGVLSTYGNEARKRDKRHRCWKGRSNAISVRRWHENPAISTKILLELKKLGPARLQDTRSMYTHHVKFYCSVWITLLIKIILPKTSQDVLSLYIPFKS